MIDLGVNQNITQIDGMGKRLLITQFPDWEFNLINVLIEPKDVKPLEGTVFVGGKGVPLSGWSKKMTLQYRPGAIGLFDLSVPEHRSYSISWWVESRQPELSEIPQSATSKTDGTIEVRYDFSATHLVGDDLRLSFDTTAFVDRRPPRIRRAEFRPVNLPDLPLDVVRGPIYDVDAELVAGRSVVMALPMPVNFLMSGGSLDSLSMMHFDDFSGKWVEVAVDSVVGSYLYFTATHFSLWTAIKRGGNWIVDRAEDTWDWLKDDVVPWVGDKILIGFGWLDYVKDFGDSIFKKLTDSFCSLLNVRHGIESLGKLLGFTEEAKKDHWDPPAGSLKHIGVVENHPTIPSSWFKSLETLRLRQLSVCTSYPSDPKREEQECWEISAENAKILLADRIATEILKKPRRFRLKKDSEAILPFGLMSLPGETYLIDKKDGEEKEYRLDKVIKFDSPLFTVTPMVYDFAETCLGESFTLADEFIQFGENLSDFVSGFEDAAGGNFAPSCRALFGMVEDAWDSDIMDCLGNTGTLYTYSMSKKIDQRAKVMDKVLIGAAETVTHLTALLYLDKEWRAQLAPQMQKLALQTDALNGLVEGFYNGNNIVIKASAATAAWRVLWSGDLDAQRRFNRYLQNHLGPKGASPEGTGYLQYIYEDVAPLQAAWVQSGILRSIDVSPKLFESAEWLMNTSRPVRVEQGTKMIPVETDDGVTYTPDLLPFSALNPWFKGWAERYPASWRGPLQFLGVSAPIPNENYPLLRGRMHSPVWFEDGVGILEAIVKTGAGAPLDTVTLSLIAESGDLWKKGMGHDQQDNLSVTLASSQRGWVIRDRGYSGFDHRTTGNVSYYRDHNVSLDLESDEWMGEKKNRDITGNDLIDMLSGINLSTTNMLNAPSMSIVLLLMTGGTGWLLADDILKWMMNKADIIDQFQGLKSGGSPASEVKLKQPITAFPNTYAMTAEQPLSSGVVHRRTLARHDDYLFVIDRIDRQRKMAVQWNTVEILNQTKVEDREIVLGDVDDWEFGTAFVRGYDNNTAAIPQNGGEQIKVYQNRWISPDNSSHAPVFVTLYNMRTGELGSGGEWHLLKDCLAALCLEHTTPGGGGELLMVTSITQDWSPVPRAYRRGDWSVKGAAVVRANGSIQMLDGKASPELLTGEEQPKEEWEIADVIVDGGELIVMDQNGNILQTLKSRSRKPFLGHLQLLLGG